MGAGQAEQALVVAGHRDSAENLNLFAAHAVGSRSFDAGLEEARYDSDLPMIVDRCPARPRERRKIGRDGAISRVKPALATADHAGKQDRNGLVRSSPGLKEVEQYFRMPAAHITEPDRKSTRLNSSHLCAPRTTSSA